MLEPDVLTTGEVNLMARPVEERTSAWNTVARFASIAFHFVVILLIILSPKIFPDRTPTNAEIARNVTDLYMPSDLRRLNRPSAPSQPRAPAMKVDPRLLRQLAPPHAMQQPSHQAPVLAEPPRETRARSTEGLARGAHVAATSGREPDSAANAASGHDSEPDVAAIFSRQSLAGLNA